MMCSASHQRATSSFDISQRWKRSGLTTMTSISQTHTQTRELSSKRLRASGQRMKKPMKSPMNFVTGFVTGMMGGRVPGKVKDMARAQGLHVYDVGDPAILLCHHNDKTHKAQVTVINSQWAGFIVKDGVFGPNAPHAIIYTVRSAAGGELTTHGTSLRPGGVLDRIALELQLAEESEALSD